MYYQMIQPLSMKRKNIPWCFVIKKHSAVVPAKTSEKQLLFKHFFVVIQSSKKQFHNISQLFQNHHLTKLVNGLFGNNKVNENIISESKAAIESLDPEDDDAMII